MQHSIFISCPRTPNSRQLLDTAARQETLVGVGFVGIGEEAFGDITAYAGSDHPMLRSSWPDGSSGYLPNGKPAFQALYDLAKAHGKLTVIATGPLTDIAMCLCAHPDLPQFLDKLLVVGGTDSFGDVTPTAERNFYNDPDAAQLVLKSGIPIILFALNTTRQLENPALCPLRYLLRPETFTTEPAGVYVETQGTVTLGKSVTDLYSDKQFPVKNVQFVMNID